MKKLLCIVFTFLIFIFDINIGFAEPLNIDPKCSYILIDSKSGQVLAEQNADIKLHPASTTKIMTGIIAIEEGNPDTVMNVSKAAVRDIGPGGMNIGIMPGEDNLTLENLLNVMLIKSANETANIIAENIGGTREQFVEKMNKKAAEIGAVNTYFVNPCGMDNASEEANHLSTARDMAIIARYAMSIPKFREIVCKLYYNDMPITDKHSKWGILQNTNKLLWDINSYPYVLNGVKEKYTVNGIKTGFTSAAGENLVSSAVSKDGMELIAVVMHVNQNNKQFTYTKGLFKYGFENYSVQKIVDANQIIKTIDINSGKVIEKLDLITASDLNAVLPVNKSEWGIMENEKINRDIKEPIKKGDILGQIEYKRNGVTLGSVNIVASRNIGSVPEKPEMKNAGNKQDSSFAYRFIIGILILLILLIVLVIARRIYVVSKRKVKYLE